MKIVFFGYDFSVAALERLLDDGHSLMAVFSFETDNFFSFHERLKALAELHKVPFTLQPARAEHIAAMTDAGCACFIAAGYPTKIPPIDFSRTKGINVHPTYLPHGRGIMPMPILIRDYPQHAGITVHKLAAKFDGGDILYQERITLMPDEDIETLSAKLVMRTPGILSRVVGDLQTYWDKAAPQDWAGGSWWHPEAESTRTFDYTHSAATINTMIRAYGRYGMIADIDGRKYAVFNAKAWEEPHSHTPGTVTARLSRETVVAISGGYVILKEFFPMDPAPV